MDNEYFCWLTSIIAPPYCPYNALLEALYTTAFEPIVPLDDNRACDGISLRHEYFLQTGLDILNPDCACSMLEMMVALAIRLENEYMSNTAYGDRTSNWFWMMITNLGLGNMTNDKFDHELFASIMTTFMNNHYTYDGQGGLFYIKNTSEDLRVHQIWTQMMWWQNSITE